MKLLIPVVTLVIGLGYGLWYAGHNTGVKFGTQKNEAGCVTGMTLDRNYILFPGGFTWDFPFVSTSQDR